MAREKQVIYNHFELYKNSPFQMFAQKFKFFFLGKGNLQFWGSRSVLTGFPHFKKGGKFSAAVKKINGYKQFL